MQLTDKRGMRTQWQLNKEFWRSVKASAVLVATLLIGLFAWNTSVLSETISKEAEMRDNIEQVILSCLNHGAAYFGGELHLCRPANVWIKKDKK